VRFYASSGGRRPRLSPSVLFLRRAFDLHQIANPAVANDVHTRDVSEVEMNYSIATADHATHLKILVIAALFWSTAVLVTAMALH
jgi:hypothetical protein